VSGISPTSGPTSGSTTVVITGSGFVPGSTVDFGAKKAKSSTFVSPTEIKAVSPAGTGSVNVTVTDAAGTSATSSADVFTYSNPS
jgi:hypothetical protein